MSLIRSLTLPGVRPFSLVTWALSSNEIRLTLIVPSWPLIWLSRLISACLASAMRLSPVVPELSLMLPEVSMIRAML
ncbi:hypothetical protein D9M73_183840 [compost metagenome]